MDSDTIDFIIRSRRTILEIVEERGYNVDSYKDVSPEDILKIATTSSQLLKIVATKTVDDITKRCIVLYWVENAVRLRLETEINALYDTDNDNHYEPSDEIIVILAEPFHEVFHVQASKQWITRKATLSFFNLKHVISNPSRHAFVPPHRKLSAEEVTAITSSLHLKSKSELPHIKYHVDMQARVLGAIPGDIIEIQRPSETCGLYTVYRVCSL
jgi:DNA-directed RNA polymerase I, II, and III subunit RPABC1